ncbi:gliding motility-associated C-terminal domain-containing protein [Neolewinella litorea]|uniref:Gliding motility-associated C-terminal domain-containing protein n=1 Tax=Neolewinella litorea TaxID=2562452 RepID=A0A4S4NU52_9BACT|nr:gliding motility-associated C-terminal domain-containing protein [Neolewinella litorea]THH42031.1 gliding motility-associated C-terminal domain-containing protein [Neolewinella litorea]
MRLRLLLALLVLLPALVTATHNRAGEIIVRAAGDCSNPGDQLRACATIITYTETAQTEVDRDSLDLNWGDGITERIGRTSITPVAPGIQRNEYTFCHRYPAFGRYVLSFQDVNRVRNVRNIPGSVNIPFSVFTSFALVNPIVNGCNTTPQLSQDPIDNACIGSVWTHNPGAFDVDGDSLAFEFTVPTFAPRAPIANYVLPNAVSGSSGSLQIDPQTGQITWDTPTIPGEYNLAFMVKSYRNGIPLDTLVRDMQIFVDDCSNDPPVIELAREQICVVAGEVVEFDVIGTAPLTDTDQRVTLTASGRPFDLTGNPATFLPQSNSPQEDPVRKTFRWQTSCNDISNQEYFVVIRAVDTGEPRPSGLATLRTVAIKVVAPPPTDLRAAVGEEEITVSWANPYACEQNEDPDFLGFTVWRREGSNNFTPDTCQTGLAGRGYTQITDTEVRDIADGRYVFTDTDVERGRTYCYRVVAVMVRRTASTGLIFEEIESLASEEICVQLARDIPLLTKVDVVSTNTTSGQIEVCWILPDAQSLDTLLNTGPYSYVLSRAVGQAADPAAFEAIQTYERPFFGDPVDTCYTDNNLNTQAQAYSYRIELFVEGENEPVGEAQPASSVRLTAAPTDRAVDLSWTELVPWTNQAYEVFRRAPGAGTYESVVTVADQMYRDTGLVNGLEYCYYVRSIGSYNLDEIPSPLLNRSQEVCAVTDDNVAPCPPQLTVESVCDRGVDCTEEENLFNTLLWKSSEEVCGDDDVVGYRIFFAPDSTGAPELVAQVDSDDLLAFDHFPTAGIVGCYTITAIDGNGNESQPSNRVCVTNCPIYDLPNAFTPNGDNQNDLFVPRGLCFVERVEFKIFNRWGQLVFETEDPAIRWDGTNLNGEALPSGTYYYVGTVFERQLQGIVAGDTPVSGYIELITSR